MIEDSPSAVPYSSFPEAYNEKSMKKVPTFYLNQRSVRPRKGAVYFVVYKGPEYDKEVEERWSSKLKETECLDNILNLKTADENDNSEPPNKKSKGLDKKTTDVFSKTTSRDLGEAQDAVAALGPSMGH